jgi:hypothetical protein
MIEIHASQISDFKCCPRMYYYRYVEHLVPKARDPKLFVGTGVHVGIAAYYRHEDPLRAYDGWLVTQFAEIGAEHAQGLAADAALGRKLVAAYVKFAERSDFFEVVYADGAPVIERQFAVPVRDPDTGGELEGVLHVGAFDGVVRDGYGRLWLMEHKTCRNFPSEAELRRREQTGYYAVAASQLFDRPVHGVIYNLIRKVDPDTAKTSVVKRVELLYTEHALRFFARNLYNACRRLMAEGVYDITDGFHCTWRCPYGALCDGEIDGIDTEYIREAMYEVAPIARVLCGGDD